MAVPVAPVGAVSESVGVAVEAPVVADAGAPPRLANGLDDAPDVAGRLNIVDGAGAAPDDWGAALPNGFDAAGAPLVGAGLVPVVPVDAAGAPVVGVLSGLLNKLGVAGLGAPGAGLLNKLNFDEVAVVGTADVEVLVCVLAGGKKEVPGAAPEVGVGCEGVADVPVGFGENMPPPPAAPSWSVGAGVDEAAGAAFLFVKPLNMPPAGAVEDAEEGAGCAEPNMDLPDGAGLLEGVVEDVAGFEPNGFVAGVEAVLFALGNRLVDEPAAEPVVAAFPNIGLDAAAPLPNRPGPPLDCVGAGLVF